MTLSGGGSRARKRARRAEIVEMIGEEDTRSFLKGRRALLRQSRQPRRDIPPAQWPARDIYEVKEKAKACGSHFFDADTMRFFKSKIIGNAIQGRDPRVTYFVTSERGPHGDRAYTVRKQVGCRINSASKFQEFSSAARAKTAARKMAGR